jgi:hypothetical protein
VIRLNLGHVYLDLYDLTNDEGFARNALYSYCEARDLLKAFPRDYAYAILGAALIVLEVGEIPGHETLADSISETTQAVDLLTNAHDLGALARAKIALGALLRARSMRVNSTDLQAAAGNFAEASSLFEATGDLANAVDATYHAANVLIAMHEL